MEDAKTVVGTLEFPTGVKTESGELLKTLTFREMAGPEEDILASQMAVSNKISSILSNCVLTFGSLKDTMSAKRYIDQLVVTDRWYYLVHLRSLSLGEDYKFETDCPSCKAVDKKVVSLLQIGVKNPPSPESLFNEASLPSGNVVRWRIADGQIEGKIEKLAKPDNAATIGLYARCTEFNGKPVALADIKNLSMKDRNVLRKQIDQVEGDFDDEIACVCPQCGHEYKVEMKLDPQSFFFP